MSFLITPPFFMHSYETPVAVFDFDHTLTDRDSLLPFLLSVQGKWKTFCLLILLTPSFISYLMGSLSRQEIKERILFRFIGGMSFNEIERLGTEYAHNQLDQYLKPEAVKRLSWHQSLGHRCLLVSASLEFYLIPWAKRRGFEAVLGSRLQISPEGKVTGELIGLNCWGLEKEQRLMSYLGQKKPRQLYVYGDSRGDREILALADFPFYRNFG